MYGSPKTAEHTPQQCSHDAGATLYGLTILAAALLLAVATSVPRLMRALALVPPLPMGRCTSDASINLQILSYKELYGWTMDDIVRAIGHKNNCTFCGVFRRQALDRGAALMEADKMATGAHFCMFPLPSARTEVRGSRLGPGNLKLQYSYQVDSK